MPLETGTWIDDLVISNPDGNDGRSEGDDHLRLIKTILKNTFPNATKAFRFETVLSSKSSVYAVTADDNRSLVPCNANGGGFDVDLPAAATAGAGFTITVVKTDASANAVTIDPSGAELVNGAATLAITKRYALVTLWCTGTAWFAQEPTDISALAPLASPAFTGNPTAPTPTTGDNDTSLATTAFVKTDAAKGDIADAGGHFTATDIEGALQEAAVLTEGQHTITIPALAFYPRATTPAAYGTEEIGGAANNNFVGWDFDPSSEERINCFIPAMPKSWNEGQVTCQIMWKDGATAGTGNVEWLVGMFAAGDSDALTSTTSSNTVVDGFITADDLHISGEFTLTPSGTPAAEDAIFIVVKRNAISGSDTYTEDARFLGLKIHYTTDAPTDD